MEWYCFKDKVEMVEADINLVYAVNKDYNRDYTFKGIRCPVCGISFVREDLALNRLATAESMYEKK
jgi:hypothetical protein